MRNAMKPIRALILLVAFGTAACALAFDQGKPEGAEFFNEQSQEQVAAQQAQQGTMEESTVVPEDDDNPTVDRKAQDAMAATMLVDKEERARANLDRAQQRLEGGKQGSKWLWPALGLIAAAGAVVGLKVWANKNVPVPTSAARRF